MPFKLSRLRLYAFISAIVLIFLSFASCSQRVSAYSLMEEFSSAAHVSGTIYSPSVPEGEAGYTDEDFFIKMYGRGREYISDYAVLLGSDIFSVSECAVFICYSEYDATEASAVLAERLELIRSVARFSDLRMYEDAFVRRYGRVVVMCAIGDSEHAGRIFDKLF